MDEAVKEKKRTFKERLKNAVIKIGNVFKDYPVTLGCIVVIAAIASVIVDCDFDTDVCEKIILFLAGYSVQALFTEEFFRDKKIERIIGYAVAAPISAFLVYIAMYDEDGLFGMSLSKTEELFASIYCCYFAVLVCCVRLIS